MYWYYTAYNSPAVYNGNNSSAMRWSATALGGAVATVIMIAATLAEFSYIPTTWNAGAHVQLPHEHGPKRLGFLGDMLQLSPAGLLLSHSHSHSSQIASLHPWMIDVTLPRCMCAHVEDVTLPDGLGSAR